MEKQTVARSGFLPIVAQRPAWRNQGSQGIKTNTTLTNLDLSENNLGPAGAESLATALKTNTTLRILNLRFNNLTSDSTEFLAKALEANTTLKSDCGSN